MYVIYYSFSMSKKSPSFFLPTELENLTLKQVGNYAFPILFYTLTPICSSLLITYIVVNHIIVMPPDVGLGAIAYVYFYFKISTLISSLVFVFIGYKYKFLLKNVSVHFALLSSLVPIILFLNYLNITNITL